MNFFSELKIFEIRQKVIGFDLYDLDYIFAFISKGQLISKTNCQAEDSPKKRTNEFVFTTVRRVFVRFLGEPSA